MRSRVHKWGNSLGLRIPKAFAVQTGLVSGSEVEVELTEGRLVVTPVARPTYRLDELLAGITPADTHDEVDLGDAVGDEVW